MVEAVLFDLYETVVTEFNPHWRDHSALTVGEQLGLREEVFRAEWRAAAGALHGSIRGLPERSA